METHASLQVSLGTTVQAPTLIDNEGEVTVACAPRMVQRLVGGEGEADWPDRAVRDLGYVLVRERAASLHVSLRPSLVTEAALAALFYHVAEAMPERVLLSYLLDDWRHEVVRGAHQAMTRLEDLVSSAALWQPSARYQEQTQALTFRKHAALERWVPLLAVWRLAGGRTPGRLTDLFATLGLIDRTVVLRVPNGSDRLIFEHRGTGLSFYRPCWSLMLFGRDLEDQPDRDYAVMTARAYRAALGARQPRFDAVDAVINSPGRDVRRYRYDRLILPWDAADGARFVSGISVLRTSYPLNSA